MQNKFQSRQMAGGQDFSRYVHIDNPDGAVSIQAATKLSSAPQEERDQIQEEFRL